MPEATPIGEMWAARKRLRLTLAQVGQHLDPPVGGPQVGYWERGDEFIPPARGIQLERLLGIELPDTAFRKPEERPRCQP